MNIKSFLLGSAAALIADIERPRCRCSGRGRTGACEYVRVCDAYGAGFFYIPGTETCLKIGGYLRYDATAGDDVYTGGHVGGEHDTWSKSASRRASI